MSNDENEDENWEFKTFQFDKESPKNTSSSEKTNTSSQTIEQVEIPEIEVEEPQRRRPESKSETSEAPSDDATTTSARGQGERILEFDLEEAEFKPVLKLILGPGKEVIFEIGEKLTLGSDKEKCKVALGLEGIQPVHMIFGVKGEDILVKHNDPEGVIVRGKKLERGKTFKLPYDVKFKTGSIFGEVLKSLPLGLEAISVKRNWQMELEDNRQEFISEDTNQNKTSKQKFKKIGPLTKLWRLLFDPRDEQEIDDDEEEEVESDWVTEEEWAKIPEAEKKDKVLLKPGEIHDKNYKKEDKQKIKKKFFLFRPFYHLLHNLKDEFSSFDNKRRNDLRKQVHYSKTKLKDKIVNHLCQGDVLKEQQALMLNNAGIKTANEVSKVPAEKLAKILKIPKEEADALRSKVGEGISKGKIKKDDKEAQVLEKKIQANESRIKSREDHLQTAGPLKRISASIGSATFIYGLYSYIKTEDLIISNLQLAQDEILPYVLKIPELVTFINLSVILDYANHPLFKPVLTYLIFHFGVQFFFHLLLGTTLGHFILGLRSNRGVLGARILGAIRYIVGCILAPFIVFDLPIIFRLKSFKEVITYNTLVRRRALPLTLEASCIILFSAIVGFGTWRLVEDGIPSKFQNDVLKGVPVKEKVIELGQFIYKRYILGQRPNPMDLLKLSGGTVVATIEKIAGVVEESLPGADVQQMTEGGNIYPTREIILKDEKSQLLFHDNFKNKLELIGPGKFSYGEQLFKASSAKILLSEGSLRLQTSAFPMLVQTPAGVVLLEDNSINFIHVNRQLKTLAIVQIKGKSQILVVNKFEFDLQKQLIDQKKILSLGNLEIGKTIAPGCFTLKFLNLPLSIPTLLNYEQLEILNGEKIELGLEQKCFPPIEVSGKWDFNENEFIPKSGSFILFPFGLPLFPEKEADFDKEKKMYLSSVTGLTMQIAIDPRVIKSDSLSIKWDQKSLGWVYSGTNPSIKSMIQNQNTSFMKDLFECQLKGGKDCLTK